MRRALGCVVIAVLLLPAVSALAEDGQETIRDDFGEVSYSGNDGSLNWSGPWAEEGESDGPASGAIRVEDGGCSNNRCLHMRGGLLSAPGIRRKADISSFVTARLTFDLSLEPALLSSGDLFVEVRQGGSGWHLLDRYPIRATGSSQESFDVAQHIGPGFELRFRLAGLLGGDHVYIDRVEIEGEVGEDAPSTTSSTTTTTPVTSSSSTSSTSPTTSTTSTTWAPGAPTGLATTTTVFSGASSTSAPRGSASTADHTGTTTAPSTTTTSIGAGGANPPESTTTTTSGMPSMTFGAAAPAPSPPPGSGLRLSRVGLLADYKTGMMGDMSMAEIEVLGAVITADFSMAVEAFEATRIWIAVLALFMAAAVVSGMDWRRSRKAEESAELIE